MRPKPNEFPSSRIPCAKNTVHLGSAWLFCIVTRMSTRPEGDYGSSFLSVTIAVSALSWQIAVLVTMAPRTTISKRRLSVGSPRHRVAFASKISSLRVVAA